MVAKHSAHVFPLGGVDPFCTLGCGMRRSQIEAHAQDPRKRYTKTSLNREEMDALITKIHDIHDLEQLKFIRQAVGNHIVDVANLIDGRNRSKDKTKPIPTKLRSPAKPTK